MEEYNLIPVRPVTYFYKIVASVVLMCFCMMTVGQSYAMDNRVAPSDDIRFATPTKSSAVVPMEYGSPTSVASVFNSPADAVQASDNKASLGASLWECVPVNLFGKSDKVQPDPGVELANRAHVQSHDTVLDHSPADSVNSATDSNQELKDDSHSVTVNLFGTSNKVHPNDNQAAVSDVRVFDNYVRKLFLGNHDPEVKNENNMHMACTAVLSAALSYELYGEVRVFVDTVINALGTTAYFYELFYYTPSGNEILNKLINGVIVNAALFLSPYLVFQSSEFIKNVMPTKEEELLRGKYGAFHKWLGQSLILTSAASAGYMIASQLFTADYGSSLTSVHNHATVASSFLGLFYAMTAYNMKTESTKDQIKQWNRYLYGDKAEEKREKLIKAVEHFKQEVEEMPEIVPTGEQQAQKATHEIVLVAPTAAEKLEHDFLELNDGLGIFKEMVGDRLIEKRKEAILTSNDTLKKFQQLHLLTEQQSLVSKMNAMLYKNRSLILSCLFALPAAYLSYVGFVGSTQITFSGQVSDIKTLRNQQTLKLDYEVFNKYNFMSDYEWCDICLNPKNLQIISNTTYEITDDTYLNTTLYDTMTYLLIFTSPKCPGLFPTTTWGASPADVAIDDYNCVGTTSWRYFFEGTIAYDAGIPNAANGYTAASVPQVTISPVGHNFAKVGAFFYAAGIYVLSVLAMNDCLNYISHTKNSKSVLMLSAFQGFIRSVPLGVAAWLAISGTVNDALLWTVIGMTVASSTLMYMPDFEVVYSMATIKTAKDRLLDKTDTLIEMIDSMDSNAVDAVFDESVGTV